ncbi:putative transposase [Rhodovulum sulfidophilum]|nr:hypothetical protein A6W98_11085 [Rhodovulum sulfidophilum DSM 1374]MCW2303751.1 putative transposase [Rhodovulum sulfidophilum]
MSISAKIGCAPQTLNAWGKKAEVDSGNRTGRHEWLDRHLSETIEEVRQIATEWLWLYNSERLYIGNGGMTPIQKLNMAA